MRAHAERLSTSPISSYSITRYQATHKSLADVILTSGFGPDLVKVAEVIWTSFMVSILTISRPSGLNLDLWNKHIFSFPIARQQCKYRIEVFCIDFPLSLIHI